MATYVLSLIGTDRTGLVESLAEVVTAHGGNWDRSHVAELAGTFAGVVLVTLPDDRAQAFRDALAPLHDRGLLDVTVEQGDVPVGGSDRELLAFDLVGNDHPGIVREVSRLLASLDVSIVDLRTWTSSASMAGGTLFHAAAVVQLPAGLDADDLVDRLEGIANELMVDVATR